jgi:hypothetical protein
VCEVLHILSLVQYHGENGTSFGEIFANSHEILYGSAGNLVYVALQSLFFMTHSQLLCVCIAAEALQKYSVPMILRRPKTIFYITERLRFT